MKNMHLIPASKQEYQVKEGGLFINDTRKHSWGKLEPLRCERITQHGHAWNGTGIRTDICHLYITSDEEIKEGAWIAYPNLKNWVPVKYLGGDLVGVEKKIILTTDQDLIKDGVQAINDEFLEWFVKNPTCEHVDVYKNWNFPLDKSWEYEIIIPQEEPNLENLESISSTELSPEFQQLVNDNWDYLIGDEPKQETLEEAKQRVLKDNYVTANDGDIFEMGAKWQAERMYSEEEVIDLLQKMNDWPTICEGRSDIEEWFEQFKKK